MIKREETHASTYAIANSRDRAAPTFLIALGAVGLAAAIAFGWGARNVAQDIVERAYERSGEVRERVERHQGDGAAATTDTAATPSARRLDR